MGGNFWGKVCWLNLGKVEGKFEEKFEGEIWEIFCRAIFGESLGKIWEKVGKILGV